MELIDKKPLLRSLVDWQMSNFTKVGHEREYNLLDSIIKGIENEPTVEAKEVVHGKWIKNKQNPEAMQAFHELGIGKGMGINSIYWTCSKCGSLGTPTSNFCSNCGCDMRTSAE